MQYILTQQEYIKLENQASINSNILLNDFYKEQYHILQEKLNKLTKEHQELQDKYSRLLVFGVSANNEKSKDNKCLKTHK